MVAINKKQIIVVVVVVVNLDSEETDVLVGVDGQWT